MAKFNKENYIHVPGFAITELKLQGNELLAFSLIHGFAQDKHSEFKGSLSYITSALNCSKTTAINVLKKLCEKEIINRRENNVGGITLVFYSIEFNNIYGSKEIVPPVHNFKQGGTESLRGGTESGHNNIIYTNDIIEKDNTNVLSKNEIFENEANQIPNDLKTEKSKRKKVAPKKEKVIPTLNEFLFYGHEIITKNNLGNPESYNYSITSKYEQWIENDWKDGNDMPINSWRSKLKNTLPYLKPLIRNGTEQQPQQERFAGRQSQQQVHDAIQRELTNSYDPRNRE